MDDITATPPVVNPELSGDPNLDKKWYNGAVKLWPIAVVTFFVAAVVAGSLWLGIWQASQSGEQMSETGLTAGPVFGFESYGDYVEILGMVIAKDDAGLILNIDKPEWLKVTLPKGEEVMKLGGKTEVSILWDQVQQGDIVRIKLTNEEQEQKLKRIFTVKPKSESTNQSTSSGN